ASPFRAFVDQAEAGIRGRHVTGVQTCALPICPVVRSLVVDGALNGVGSVLSFLPTIVLLFFFLSSLEDSGYMARVAFIMAKPLRPEERRVGRGRRSRGAAARASGTRTRRARPD